MRVRPVHWRRRLTLAATASLVAASTVSAAAAAESPPGPSPLSGGELLSMSMNLLLVIGAILIFGWIYMRSQGLRSARNGHFRVLAAQPLGAREKVVLLQVGEQQVVVGISPGGMTTLLVPEKPVIPGTTDGNTDSATFAERLRSAFAAGGRADP